MYRVTAACLINVPDNDSVLSFWGDYGSLTDGNNFRHSGCV